MASKLPHPALLCFWCTNRICCKKIDFLLINDIKVNLITSYRFIRTKNLHFFFWLNRLMRKCIKSKVEESIKSEVCQDQKFEFLVLANLSFIWLYTWIHWPIWAFFRLFHWINVDNHDQCAMDKMNGNVSYINLLLELWLHDS